MTFEQAKEELARKLGISLTNLSTNGLFTDDDLNSYLNIGAMKAWDFAPWDFAEKGKSGTLDSTDMTNGYISYPEEISPLSIYLFKINNKEYSKLRFRDYQKFKEDYPTKDTKFWSEHDRLIFFNTNSCSAGDSVDVYGKEALSQLSSPSDLLPFSHDSNTRQNSGNQAIVLLAYAEALGSEKKKNFKQAVEEEKKAFGILGSIFNQSTAGRLAEAGQNRPQFSVPDMFGRGTNGTGTFNNFN